MCSTSYAIVSQYVSCSRGSASASVSPSTYVRSSRAGMRACSSGRQLRVHALGLERGIAGRLGAERVEPRREMPVRAVRLDERHRRRDTFEQLVVGLGRRRRASSGRSRRGRAPFVRRSSSRTRPGCSPSSSPSSRGLEERTPLLGDGRRVLEILLEQLTREARVQRVDVVRHDVSLAAAFSAISRADCSSSRRSSRRRRTRARRRRRRSAAAARPSAPSPSR